MGLINNAPPPIGDAIAQPLRKEYKPGTDPQEGQVSQPWADWFTNLMANQEKAAGRVVQVDLISRDSSIATQNLSDIVLTAGLYRFSYFLHVTTADVGGSIEVTAFFTSKGSVLRYTFPLGDTSTSASWQHGIVGLVYIDTNAPVQYQTDYTPSSGGVIYDFHAVLEEISA